MTERRIKKRPFYGSTSQEIAPYETAHRKIAREAAAEGIVLLKNENQLLPLAAGSRVAVYGPGASHTIKGGTGSGDVNERESVSICQGLRNAGFRITNEEWIRSFDQRYEEARYSWRDEIFAKRNTEEGRKTRFFAIYASTPFVMPEGPLVDKTDADAAFYVLTRNAGEGADRTAAPGDYYLTDSERRDIRDICTNYSNVILVINAGGIVDLSFTDEFENIRSILYVVQPGMEGGNAFADIVSGKVTPCGKLTDTWAKKYEDYPSARSFSESSRNAFKEQYEEGIYVGYRYFDSFGIPAVYSFGHGLSYTSFALEVMKVNAGSKVETEVKVTNTGSSWSGREVVQAYISAPAGTIEKEYRRLCGFAKTSVLAPGESEILTLSWPAYQMASYDSQKAQWILEAGTYGLWVGNSLENAGLKATLELPEKKVLKKLRNICPLKDELKEFSLAWQQRRERYERVITCAREKELPAVLWDLSALETESMDYSLPYEPDDDEAAQLVNRLDIEQLIKLATGDPSKGQGSVLGAAGLCVAGSAGETSKAALGQGVANIVLADGPAGLRLAPKYSVENGTLRMPPFEVAIEHGFFAEGLVMEGTPYYQYCTAIPVGTLLAQSWDETLIERTGAMIAEEMVRFGVTLWLAPGMNIHRNPLCGRNFEYYSEDPLVSGKMAAAMTRGVQSVPGCGTTIKHFACNNREDHRKDSDSILSERALREIYLKGFEIAVRESRPMSIMTSYNLINGVHAANCYDLCTAAARQEWGFDGVIMTDWTTTYNDETCTASGCMRAGNDLVMPGQPDDHDNIRKELAQGTLTEEELKKCIARLVRVVFRSNLYE